MTYRWEDLNRAVPFLMVAAATVALRISRTIGTWILIFTVVWLLSQTIRHWNSMGSSLELALLGGLLLWATISLSWSPDSQRGLRLVFGIAIAFLTYIWGKISGPPGGSSRLWMAGVAGLVLSLVGLIAIPDPEAIDALSPDRMLGMGVIALLVAAWYGPRSRIYVMLVGLAALGTGIFSGSRMASFVILLLLVTAPGLRLPKAGRALIATFIAFVFVLASTTTSFQERWSESDAGAILEVITFQDLDSSGRFGVWPELVEECGATILGNGAGAADSYSRSINPGFPEPHNEYIRVWCDTGIPGTLLMWGFLASVAGGAVAGLRTGGVGNWVHVAALQMAVSLLLMSITDNPLTTSLLFMIPAALVFGWSRAVRDQQESSRPRRRLPQWPREPTSENR